MMKGRNITEFQRRRHLQFSSGKVSLKEWYLIKHLKKWSWLRSLKKRNRTSRDCHDKRDWDAHRTKWEKHVMKEEGGGALANATRQPYKIKTGKQKQEKKQKQKTQIEECLRREFSTDTWLFLVNKHLHPSTLNPSRNHVSVLSWKCIYILPLFTPSNATPNLSLHKSLI